MAPGLLIAPPVVIKSLRKVHDFLTVGAAAPLQEAAVAALEFPDTYYQGLHAGYAEKRGVFLKYLDQAGLTYTRPQGAYYVMVDISEFGWDNDTAFANGWRERSGCGGARIELLSRAGENLIRFHFAKQTPTLQAAGDGTQAARESSKSPSSKPLLDASEPHR